MAMNLPPNTRRTTPIAEELERACVDFGEYVHAIVEPAMDRLLADMQRGPVSLHQVFGANVFLAHAVDYLRAIRTADGFKETRTNLVQGFDETFSVEGARIGNRKFELIDAINNSLKHISLDSDRYDHLVKKYGQISFRSLAEEDGQVLCILDGYRFDYARVVLRPAYRAIAGMGHASAESILNFARGDAVVEHWVADDLMSSSDPADAIDQMIEHCNPACEDCGERELECKCAQFIYNGAEGKFVRTFHAHFDFDTVMSRISGAYRPERP
jgi:hypothetical protein